MSGRIFMFAAPNPRACFTIPAPMVTLGLALCSGNGTCAAPIPRMREGSISIWVCSGVASEGLIAMKRSSSSSASIISINPLFTRVANSISFFLSFSMSSSVTSGFPWFKTISGRRALPRSVWMITSLLNSLWEIFTSAEIAPWRRIART
ncbi:MAG: hypothetical protein A4E42_00817 [Methanoregulaceae archaeon PtaU1.Bin222]|nr:MAG: hypothetical protein A4E42_00817 [Methanoregulaceae archaeon PtaU1.Bin222]